MLMMKIIFYGPKTYEQIEIKKEIIGEKGMLLSENLEVVVSFTMKPIIY